MSGVLDSTLFAGGASYSGSNNFVSDVASPVDMGGYELTSTKKDFSGNIYHLLNSNFNYPILVKFSSSGLYLWSNILQTNYSSIGNIAIDINFDSSDNVYLSSYFNFTTLIKLSSDGNILWCRQFDAPSISLAETQSYSTLASNLVYILTVSTNVISLSVFNQSDGASQWRKYIYFGSPNSIRTRDVKITADSSGNIIIASIINDSFQIYDSMYIVKYNSSGVLQWQKSFYDSSIYRPGWYLYMGAVKTDSSNNIYIYAGHQIMTASNNRPSYLIKLNTSGTVQWAKSIFNKSSRAISLFNNDKLSIDGSNLYFILFKDITYTNSGHYSILKFNLSGTLQWSRQITMFNNYNNYDDNIDLKSVDLASGNFLLGTYDVANYGNYIISLPKDGTKTGSYTLNKVDPADFSITLNYAIDSITTTISDVSITATSNSFSNGTGSLSDSSFFIAVTPTSIDLAWTITDLGA